MIEENRRSRRLVTRLGRGESIRSALESLARDRSVTTAWISGHGVIARATVETRVPMRPDEASRRTVEGPFELASLVGDLASKEGVMHLDASVVLTRYADHGMVIVAGHLVDAEAEGVTVMVDCLDDLGLRREVERPTGLDGFRKSDGFGRPAERTEARAPAPVTIARGVATPTRPAQVATPPPATPSAWAAVAAMSSGGTAAPATAAIDDPIADRGRKDEPEDYIPEAGDWVDHRQFGLCRVDRSTPDGELLIKLETGRRKEIRLDVLEVLAPRIDGARKIFPLRPRRR